MRNLVFFLCFSCIVSGAFAQAFETVSAGVIDFLVSNPKTANRMNSTEKAGLTVVGNLLNIAGQRKHDMNVANAGRQQVIIQETTGKQAEIVLDPEGNVYLKHNHMVYPINQGFVKQAEEEFVPKHEVKNEYLPPFNIERLRSSFFFEIPKDYEKHGYHKYTVTEPKGEYMSVIAKKLGISVYDLELEYFKGMALYFKFERNMRLKKLRADKIKAKKKTRFKYFILSSDLVTKIPFLFTCKWAMDLDENGLDFDDFQVVKNSFVKNEDILIVSGYQTDKDSCLYSVEVYAGEAGNLLFRREGTAPPIYNVIQEKISATVLAPGVYIYIIKLKRKLITIASKKERFEIRDEE